MGQYLIFHCCKIVHKCCSGVALMDLVKILGLKAKNKYWTRGERNFIISPIGIKQLWKIFIYKFSMCGMIYLVHELREIIIAMFPLSMFLFKC